MSPASLADTHGSITCNPAGAEIFNQRWPDINAAIRAGLTDETAEKIQTGDEMVKRSGMSSAQIIANIHDLSRTMEETAAASGQQAGGVEEVNLSVAVKAWRPAERC
mgnify:CR=1 FL=1